MARRPRGRAIDGWLVLDKPAGITSAHAVALVKRAFDARKAGHAGTLDPAATGLLAIAFGAATKTIPFVTDADKAYRFTVRWGAATETDDAEGAVIATRDTRPTDAEIEAALPAFRGDILQVPPQVSAVKVAGERAYDLARAGEHVELKARRVLISRFAVQEIRRSDAVVDVDVVVDCSSGTYIRALARDLGAALGVGGHLTALRRTRIGPFDVADAVAEITPEAPLRADAEVAAAVLGVLEVTADEARDLRHGKRLPGAASRLVSTTPAAIDPDGRLVGVVERRGDDVKSIMNVSEEQP